MSRYLFFTLLCLAIALPTVAVARQPGFDLQGALADAQAGDTIVIPSGTYPGPLAIDKSLTLQGQGWPVIAGDGEGTVITVNAEQVTLRGLVIRHSGDSLDHEHAGIAGLAPHLTVEGNRLEDVLFGVYLKEAPFSVVRDNEIQGKDLELGRRGDGIRLWYSGDSLVAGNHVRHGRDVIMWFSPDSVVRDNVVEDSRYGLHFMFSDHQLVEGNVLRNNSVGAFLMYGRGLTMRRNLLHGNHGPSGFGVGLKDVDDAVLEGNRMVANRVGAYIDNSPREANATLRFQNNVLAYNESGITLLALTRRNTYTGNIFQENGEQVEVLGGHLEGINWSDAGQGNYWSDYTGFDANSDHIGDLPYHAQSLYEDLMATHPELRLFQLSPATNALDLAASAFPIFQPQPKMADEYPLMTPPTLPIVPGLASPPLVSNLAAALALLLVAGIVLGLGLRPGGGWRITGGYIDNSE